jgi:hypothetical protein
MSDNNTSKNNKDRYGEYEIKYRSRCGTPYKAYKKLSSIIHPDELGCECKICEQYNDYLYK